MRLIYNRHTHDRTQPQDSIAWHVCVCVKVLPFPFQKCPGLADFSDAALCIGHKRIPGRLPQRFGPRGVTGCTHLEVGNRHVPGRLRLTVRPLRRHCPHFVGAADELFGVNIACGHVDKVLVQLRQARERGGVQSGGVCDGGKYLGLQGVVQDLGAIHVAATLAVGLLGDPLVGIAVASLVPYRVEVAVCVCVRVCVCVYVFVAACMCLCARM